MRYFVPVHGHLGAAVLAVQHAIARGDLHRGPAAIVVRLAGTDGNDLALLGLFLCGVRDVQATPHLLGLFQGPHHNAIRQGLDLLCGRHALLLG